MRLFSVFTDVPPDWLMEWNRYPAVINLFVMGAVSAIFGVEDFQLALPILATTRIVVTVTVWGFGVLSCVKTIPPRAFEGCVLAAHVVWGSLMLGGMICVPSGHLAVDDHHYVITYGRAPAGCVSVFIAVSQALFLLAGMRTLPTALCMVSVLCVGLAVLVINTLTDSDTGAIFVRAVFAITMWSLLFLVALFMQDRRWKALYVTQQALGAEKEAVKTLLTMVCDADFWIAADCETVLRSEPRFDAAMGMAMQGERVSAHMPEGERQRLRHALTENALQSEPSVQLLPTTLLRARGPPVQVDLFIVDRRLEFASHRAGKWDGAGAPPPGSRLGFLIGLRFSSEPLGAEPATPRVAEGLAVGGAAMAKFAAVTGLVHAPPSVSSEGAAGAAAGSRPWCAGGARTHVSAPGVLEQSKLLEFMSGATPCQQGSGDCLPPDAAVWVEGRSLPTELGAVEHGQKVLCYDHLGRGLKFAEITEVEVHDATDEVEWVELTLDDGTRLEMTSDHPVFPQPASAGPGLGEVSRAVKACELEPELHSLEILKVVPVPVKRVRRLTHGAAGEGGRPPARARVTVSVQQPERHSLFVAPGSDPTQSMAVASCSAAVGQRPRGWEVRNTFIVETAGSPEVRRALSDPQLFAGGGPPPRAERHECVSDLAGSTMSVSDAISCVSSAGAESAFFLGASAADARLGAVSFTDYVRFSELQGLRTAGVSSIGSVGHAQGACRPCVMQHRYHQEGTDVRMQCKFQGLCGRCHEPHSRAQLKSAQRRVKRDGARAGP